MNKDAAVFITGHEGMIGAAIRRRLQADGFTKLITRTSARLDLTDQGAVFDFFDAEKPEYVFLNSARVGGILANRTYPARFIYDNLQSQANVIHAAWRSGVKKLLYFGSSCIYPKNSPQPMKETYLLDGKLEPTSEPYAIAKIAGIKMCQAYNAEYGTDYISAVPGDVYGPGDDFDPETAHALPALMARMHRAHSLGEPEVVVWGSGSPRRETLYVDDLADAAVFLMDNYDDSEIINVGSGRDVSIRDMGRLVRETVGFRGDIVFDRSKPDGIPLKLLDSRRLTEMGWAPRTGFEEGLRQTYRWYREHIGTPVAP
jgi:GDP-L-fucose synthase